MKVYTNHCARGSNTASICGLKHGCGSGQNLRTDVDEIFRDPHLSGCMLPGWSTPLLWARDDGIMTSQSPGTEHYVPMPGVSHSQEAVDTR